MFYAYALAFAWAISTALSSPSGLFENTNARSGTAKSIVPTADGDGRSSDLKFVLAIRSTDMWTVIKRRSLTVKTGPPADGLFDKSPEDMSDGDLKRLKQACHDGLKCVAVDQLLVLQTCESPTAGGKWSVRTAIVKITKVLTEYTAEYHEDMYRYEEVAETDDVSRVSRSVVAIVEDNKELCRIGPGDAYVEYDDVRAAVNATATDGGGGATGNAGAAGADRKAAAPPVYGRRATVAGHQNQPAGGKTAKRVPTGRGATAAGSPEAVGGRVAVVLDTAAGDPGKNNHRVNADIVTAGSHNSGRLRKGYAENGAVNNGRMEMFNFNSGTINKGQVDQSDAGHGLINVGTVNNGPANYGAYDALDDGGTVAAAHGSRDVKNYATSVDKMFSAVLESFAK